jgi:hypothetical protein
MKIGHCGSRRLVGRKEGRKVVEMEVVEMVEGVVKSRKR